MSEFDELDVLIAIRDVGVDSLVSIALISESRPPWTGLSRLATGAFARDTSVG